MTAHVTQSLNVCSRSFFLKQKTAYEMRISDWSSDVCSSDLLFARRCTEQVAERKGHDATAKMRTDMGIGITCKYKLDLVLPYPAAPAGGKAERKSVV